MQRLFLLALSFVLLAGCSTVKTPPPAESRVARNTGPWDLDALKLTPTYTTGEKKGVVEEIYYEGEPYRGKPTRIFAYLARPAEGKGPYPAMLLVHGGGGKAFQDWAVHWAKRGYIALAMDTAGAGPKGPQPDGGPDQTDETKFRNFSDDEVRDMWTYHAIAAVLRGHSLLASLPEVDAKRIGITGISWGGYLTCIAAGVDERLKVAVPVYGCGFLGENSYWTDRSLAAMLPEARERWLRLFDPSQYLGAVSCPILFLNGSNDFAYPMDSYRKSYRLVPPAIRQVCVVTNLPHGHIWTFPEVDRFVDQVLLKSEPSPRLGEMRIAGEEVTATFAGPKPIKWAALNYTTDTGRWQERRWKAIPAEVTEDKIKAKLPLQRPIVFFLSATDQRSLRTSTEHEVLE